MDLENYVTCSQCLRELPATGIYEIENAMVSNYRCKQCCYTFSIYSITKTKLAEINGGTLPERCQTNRHDVGKEQTITSLAEQEVHPLEDK